jgi:glyoxylase-like metal-dependent hydrolase (beta-lactamase superfamily II)
MLRPLLLVLSGVAVLLLGGFWWLFLADSTAPDEAPGLLVLEDWRAMVPDDPSRLPTGIRVLEIGRDKAPGFAARAGGFGTDWNTTYNSVQIVWPDRTMIIDGAIDAETAAAMKQSEADWAFDASAYETLLAAMLSAESVLITHEHLDHVMAVARHPDPAALAPKLLLNAPQIATLPIFAKGTLDPAIAGLAPRLDGSVQQVAPGVVIIPVPGHTPGSQLVYIQLQNGNETLLIGDVAWTLDAVETLTTRPVLTQYAVFDPDEDRTSVKAQLRALYDLMQANPDLAVLPAHDSGQLAELIAEGRLQQGFAE